MILTFQRYFKRFFVYVNFMPVGKTLTNLYLNLPFVNPALLGNDLSKNYLQSFLILGTIVYNKRKSIQHCFISVYNNKYTVRRLWYAYVVIVYRKNVNGFYVVVQKSIYFYTFKKKNGKHNRLLMYPTRSRANSFLVFFFSVMLL